MFQGIHVDTIDPLQITFVVLGIIWVLYWKALALWYAARKGMRGWFIVFLIVNTFSILEIFYVVYYVKESPKHFLRN